MTVPRIGPSSVPIPSMMTIKIIATTQFKSKPVVTPRADLPFSGNAVFIIEYVHN
jgi:hypothetical protein